MVCRGPTMVGVPWRGWEASRCFSHNLELKAREITGELLVFSQHWKPEEARSATSNASANECPSDRQVNLSVRMKTRRHKANFPSSMSFYLGCSQKVLLTLRVCFSVSNNLVKKDPHGCLWLLCLPFGSIPPTGWTHSESLYRRGNAYTQLDIHWLADITKSSPLSEEKPCWRSGGAEGEEKGFGKNWEEGMEGKLW